MRLCRLKREELEALVDQAESIFDSQRLDVDLESAALAPFEGDKEEERFRHWCRSNAEELIAEGVLRNAERHEVLLRRLWTETRRAQDMAHDFEVIRKRELHARVFHALQRTWRCMASKGVIRPPLTHIPVQNINRYHA